MSTTDKDFKAITEFSVDLMPGNVKAAMAGNKSSDLWKVPPHQIRILPGYNPRIRSAKYAAKIRWLADQMKEHGYYADKPLAGFVAMENGVAVPYLQDGHGRHEAVLLAIAEGAPIETVPMVMKDRTMGIEELTIALVTSNEGEPFGPMEKAALVKRFRAFGKTDTEIAQIMRCTPAYVGQLATLAGAPRQIRDMVANEEVSATLAIEMIRKHGDKAGEQLEGALDHAKTQGKTKASAKHSAAAALIARQKKFGPALFEVMGRYLDTKPNIPGPFDEEIDKIFADAERVKAPKEPKKPKAAKVKAVRVPKVPLAKKVAAATRKS